jgi:hypothetical protein
VATRYAELAGGSSADGASFSASLAQAIGRLTAGAGPDHLEMAFEPDDAGVRADLSCNGRRETVTVKISVASTDRLRRRAKGKGQRAKQAASPED